MTDLVDVVLEDAEWAPFGLEEIAARACAATFAHLGLPARGYEIALLACDDARIAGLNSEFRGKDGATNVLSWPAFDLAPPEPGARPDPPPPPCPDDPESLGDMALARETCLREAALQGKPVADHLAHLIVHGCLHLLGYDHVTQKDAEVMEALEIAILAKLGVPDPY